LAYGNNLKVVRAVTAADLNAVSTGAGVQIKNLQTYTTSGATLLSGKGPWAAKYPGDLGNSLKVVVLDSASSDNYGETSGTEDYADWMDNFDNVPSTSTYAESLGLSGINDEIHILVIDKDGKWTGTPGKILEKYAFLSKASNGIKSDGTSNYYKTVINNESKYIWWVSHPQSKTWGTELTPTAAAFPVLSGSIQINSLVNGANHTSISDAAIAALYNTYFGDPSPVH
jgi:hypothetical protein